MRGHFQNRASRASAPLGPAGGGLLLAGLAPFLTLSSRLQLSSHVTRSAFLWDFSSVGVWRVSFLRVSLLTRTSAAPFLLLLASKRPVQARTQKEDVTYITWKYIQIDVHIYDHTNCTYSRRYKRIEKDVSFFRTPLEIRPLPST